MNDLEKLFAEAEADDEAVADEKKPVAGKQTPPAAEAAPESTEEKPGAAESVDLSLDGMDSAPRTEPSELQEDGALSEGEEVLPEALELDPSEDIEENSAADGEDNQDPLDPLSWAPPPLDIKGLLEALLLVEKDGLKLRRVTHVTGLPYAVIKDAMDSLLLDYRARRGGLVILRERRGYVLATRQDLAEDVQNFIKVREVRLSRAAYETLAVIAINQPVTKAEIERIRGVGADSMISTLRSKNLVRVMGRKEVHGRPTLYGVGMMFFKHFGIRSLKEFRSFARRLRMLGELPPPMEGEEVQVSAADAMGEIGIILPDDLQHQIPLSDQDQKPGNPDEVILTDADEDDEWEPGNDVDDFDFPPREN